MELKACAFLKGMCREKGSLLCLPILCFPIPSQSPPLLFGDRFSHGSDYPLVCHTAEGNLELCFSAYPPPPAEIIGVHRHSRL